MSPRRILIAVVTATSVSILGLGAAATYPGDCEGPAPDADPGTSEWVVRDTHNIYCGQVRHLDQAQHPITQTLAPGASPTTDGYREPARHHGTRFRYQASTIGSSAIEIYHPCSADTCTNMPPDLAQFEPPYPALIHLHGGGSRKELHWWSSQSLAEAGYIVVTPDGASANTARAVLNALFDEDDPRFADFNREPVGIAGHSIGGDAALIVASTDARVGAYVGWDRAGLSSPSAADRANGPPQIHINGDYGCPAPLVCPPEPRLDYPAPGSRGAKALDHGLAVDNGIDSMMVWLRAALHFDWVPSGLSGNRYVELLNVYYMKAWYDLYLKGPSDPDLAADAFRRLSADVYDDTADIHNISQGYYDYATALAADDLYAGNVPYAIEGMPARDRLSFYYVSQCDIGVPDSSERAASVDLRASPCTASTP